MNKVEWILKASKLMINLIKLNNESFMDLELKKVRKEQHHMYRYLCYMEEEIKSCKKKR